MQSRRNSELTGAWEFPLLPMLQNAVNLQVLTFQEAWLVQDQYLLQQHEENPVLPPHLQRLHDRLYLLELEPVNLLPV